MSKVIIIGDIIVDKYIYGTSSRLSPEAPVPIVVQKNIIEKTGGAGLVYENLKSLGVDVDILKLSNPPCIKTRIICDGHYVTRIDEDFITENASDIICQTDFTNYDYVIISDYNKGVVDQTRQIIDHINSFNCKIIVDPKREYSKYAGAWLVKPNFKEYHDFNFKKWSGNIITTDGDNFVTAKIDGRNYSIKPEKVEVNDVTGAGDCFIAGFVYGLINNYDYETCLLLATKSATTSVNHLGTYVIQPEDIIDKVVFTNGCFDVLHAGHLQLLKQAKQKGNKLIVGLNSDASVKKLKGISRPINNVEIRKEQLLALPWVDEVIIFNEETPYNLIKKIKPFLIVKGGDYTVDQVVGNDLANVEIIPILKNYSSTKIIEKIK